MSLVISVLSVLMPMAWQEFLKSKAIIEAETKKISP
jgi:hypothetical protein